MKQLVNAHTTPGWPSIEVDFDRPIELFIDSFQGYDAARNSFKILWVKESEEISKFKSLAIEHHAKFDAILTYDEEILKTCNNSHFLAFGTSWISNYDLTKPKKFQISHLTGFKEITEGHILRKKVHYKQNRIKTPKDFYISQHGGVENSFNNKTLFDTKNPLFDSQFHICIENSRQKNFFTEKLIDCLVTKTIPIYWGCENIDKFFDTRGFILVENFDDIINACNSISENTYNEKLEFINYNFELSKKYITIIDRLKEKIEEILKLEINKPINKNTKRFVKNDSEYKGRGYFSYMYQLVGNIYQHNLMDEDIKLYVNLENIEGYKSEINKSSNIFEYCFTQDFEDFKNNKSEYIDLEIDNYIHPYLPNCLTKEIRLKTKEIINKYFKLKEEIKKEIEEKSNSINFEKTLAVHRRSTDIYMHHPIVPIEKYFEIIDKEEFENIFLLCDNKKDYDLFLEKYGKKIIQVDTTFSLDNNPYFKSKEKKVDAEHHCKEMVANIFMFSKCKKAIMPLSNYSGFSLLINPDLDFIILK